MVARRNGGDKVKTRKEIEEQLRQEKMALINRQGFGFDGIAEMNRIISLCWVLGVRCPSATEIWGEYNRGELKEAA